jgi:hypothetical protein
MKAPPALMAVLVLPPAGYRVLHVVVAAADDFALSISEHGGQRRVPVEVKVALRT